MDEKLYKKARSVGASNVVWGILLLITGLTAGIMLLVNGGRLLSHKSDTLF